MHWIKKILPVLLIVLIIVTNIVTVVLLMKRENSSHATVGFAKPDKIVVMQGEKSRSFAPDTPEYKELYERNENRCRQVSYLNYPLHEVTDEETALTISYEYDTPLEVQLPAYKEIVDISVRQVRFILTGENYDTLHIIGEPERIYISLPADTKLIERATQILTE